MVATLAGSLALASSASAGVVTSGGVRYASKNLTLQPHKTARATAACPRHTHVLGGGAFSAAGFGTTDLRQSYPADLGDRDKKPDDGWGNVVRNTTNVPELVILRASCGKANVRYVAKQHAVTTGGEQEQDTPCPGPLSAYSGGVSGPTRVAFDSSFPVDVGSKSGWGSYATAENKDAKATYYTVCLARAVTYAVTSYDNVPNNEESGGRSECPTNRRAYGAALVSNGTRPDVIINTLAPVAPDNSYDSSAAGYYDFTGAFTLDITVTATCGPTL